MHYIVPIDRKSFKGGLIFNTASSAAPHCVRECWDGTQDCCEYGIGIQALCLTTRPDLVDEIYRKVLAVLYLHERKIWHLNFFRYIFYSTY
jgi:hypothetical protein